MFGITTWQQAIMFVVVVVVSALAFVYVFKEVILPLIKTITS